MSDRFEVRDQVSRDGKRLTRHIRPVSPREVSMTKASDSLVCGPCPRCEAPNVCGFKDQSGNWTSTSCKCFREPPPERKASDNLVERLDVPAFAKTLYEAHAKHHGFPGERWNEEPWQSRHSWLNIANAAIEATRIEKLQAALLEAGEALAYARIAIIEATEPRTRHELLIDALTKIDAALINTHDWRDR